MTNDDLCQLEGEPTVLLADGVFGMVIFGYNLPECGVQVPGEPDARQVPVADLQRTADGAIRQKGAPENPTMQMGEHTVQSLLAWDWKARGGLTQDFY